MIAAAVVATIGCGPSNTDTDILEECIATCIESGGTRMSCQGDCTNSLGAEKEF